MSRPDKEEFMNSFAFGVIPAGTSNGLHKSIVEDANVNEDVGIHSAAFAAAKGRVMKMDLTECEMEYTTEKVYMFLTMSYAIVADADIGSEHLRAIGEARFVLWGGYRVFNLRQYPGTLTCNGAKVTSSLP